MAAFIKKGQPDLAYVGGIEVWRSGPNQQAELAAFAFDFAGTDFDVHADVHDIIFTPAGTMYVTTDGGIYKSTDGGQTYVECNRDYSVTQFYGMDHSSRSAVLGGTQDNGTQRLTGTGTARPAATALPAVKVRVSAVQAADLPQLAEVTGTVRPIQRATLDGLFEEDKG